jgi:hypothetical protein
LGLEFFPEQRILKGKLDSFDQLTLYIKAVDPHGEEIQDQIILKA